MAAEPPVGSTGICRENSHRFGVPRGGHVDWHLSSAETQESGDGGRDKRDPQRGTTASLAQAFPRALLQSAGFSCCAWPSPEQEKLMCPRILSYCVGLPETLKAKAEEC